MTPNNLVDLFVVVNRFYADSMPDYTTFIGGLKPREGFDIRFEEDGVLYGIVCSTPFKSYPPFNIGHGVKMFCKGDEFYFSIEQALDPYLDELDDWVAGVNFILSRMLKDLKRQVEEVRND